QADSVTLDPFDATARANRGCVFVATTAADTRYGFGAPGASDEDQLPPRVRSQRVARERGVAARSPLKNRSPGDWRICSWATVPSSCRAFSMTVAAARSITAGCLTRPSGPGGPHQYQPAGT